MTDEVLPPIPPEEMIRYHLGEMNDWIEGRRSWCNLGWDPPYTPGVIAAMDAQEVVKHAAAVQAYAALSNRRTTDE